MPSFRGPGIHYWKKNSTFCIYSQADSDAGNEDENFPTASSRKRSVRKPAKLGGLWNRDRCSHCQSNQPTLTTELQKQARNPTLHGTQARYTREVPLQLPSWLGSWVSHLILLASVSKLYTEANIVPQSPNSQAYVSVT